MRKIIPLPRKRFIYVSIDRKHIYLEVLGLGIGISVKKIWFQYLPNIKRVKEV